MARRPVRALPLPGSADAALREQYWRLLRREDRREDDVLELRRLVLLRGVPDASPAEARSGAAHCSLRACVWKVLLGVSSLNADAYAATVAREASAVDTKIAADVTRTFPSDAKFARRVPQAALTRVLNAFAHINADAAEARRARRAAAADGAADSAPGDVGAGAELAIRYVQGLNVWAGVLLYVLPELDAFHCYHRLLTFHAPRYAMNHLDGVHEGCRLVGACLREVDPELHAALARKGLGEPRLYAFPWLLGLFASIPPLAEAVHVWDAMLAYGVHLAVPLCVAQVLLLRRRLLATDAPMAVLAPRSSHVSLNARVLIPLAMHVVTQLPDGLCSAIARHTYESVFAGPEDLLPASPETLSRAPAAVVSPPETPPKRKVRRALSVGRLRPGSSGGSAPTAAPAGASAGASRSRPRTPRRGRSGRATTPRRGSSSGTSPGSSAPGSAGRAPGSAGRAPGRATAPRRGAGPTSTSGETGRSPGVSRRAAAGRSRRAASPARGGGGGGRATTPTRRVRRTADV